MANQLFANVGSLDVVTLEILQGFGYYNIRGLLYFWIAQKSLIVRVKHFQ